jgi:hypothetical protein
MKGLGGLFIFGALVLVGGLYMQAKLFSDAGRPLQLAYEAIDDTEVEMALVVPIVMPAADRPRANERGFVLWDEWVEDHFQLYDSSDNLLPLRRSNHCRFIPARKVIGTEEFFLSAKLMSGQDYVFECVPVQAKSKRYRYSFTAPASNVGVEMVLFEPVK